MVNGEPLDLEACGVTDVHLRGIPLIEPRRKKVPVTRRDKTPQRRRASRVEVSVVRIRRKGDRTLEAMRAMNFG